MVLKDITAAHRVPTSHDDDAVVLSWQRVVLVITMAASIASGIGAYAVLSATPPAPNRVSWSLEPPKSARAAARVAAPGNLHAAVTEQRRRMREM